MDPNDHFRCWVSDELSYVIGHMEGSLKIANETNVDFDSDDVGQWIGWLKEIRDGSRSYGKGTKKS